MEKFGIDVSSYQGKINFLQLKDNKIDFVILRASVKNNNKDTCLDTYYRDAIAAGLDIGVYKYVYAANVSDAIKEANTVVSYIKDKKLKAGVWIDMEDKSLTNLSALALKAIIDAEAKIYKAAGFNVGIYCNKSWYDKVLNAKNNLSDYPFWIARYPIIDKGTYNKDSSLSPTSYAKAWQYSSKGRVSGISTYVDMDVIFCDFDTMFTAKVKEIAKPVIAINRDNDKAEVKKLQQHLNKLGFVGKDQKALNVDGLFGQNSEYALKRFQCAYRDCGNPDGIYGTKTYAAMKSAIERSK